MSDAKERAAVIDRLKQRIEVLTEQQIQALRLKALIGMTPDEAQNYDELQKQITSLIQELDSLKRAQIASQ